MSNGERGPGWGKGYIGDYYPGRDFDYIEEEKDRAMHLDDTIGVKTLILTDAPADAMGVPVQVHSPRQSAPDQFIYVDFPNVLTPEVGMWDEIQNRTAWVNFNRYMKNPWINKVMYDANGTELTEQYLYNNAENMSIRDTKIFEKVYNRDKSGNIIGHKMVPMGGMLDVMTRVTDEEQNPQGAIQQKYTQIGGYGKLDKTSFFTNVFHRTEARGDKELQDFIYGRNTASAMYLDEYTPQDQESANYIIIKKSCH